MSWLRLTATSNCFPHPYYTYKVFENIDICCPLAYSNSLTQIPTTLGSYFAVLGHLWSQHEHDAITTTTAGILYLLPRPVQPLKESSYAEGQSQSQTASQSEPLERCEHIPTWISLSGDLAFSHQDGIYGFKFPKRFSELSQAKTSLYSLYLLY